MPARASAAQKPRRSLRRRLAFSCVALFLSTSVALISGEFCVRWHMEGSFFEALDSVFGSRTAAAAERTPAMVPDPELGFRLNPAQDGVNSMGLRYPESITEKPAGQWRLLVVGDSVSFPWNGFVGLLRDELRREDPRQLVINAAVHGYTTYQERRFLERDLMRLRPDLVVVQYCVNDNFRFLHRITSKGRRLMTLEAKNELFPEGGGLAGWLSRNSYLAYAVRKALFAAAQDAGRELWKHRFARTAWEEDAWRAQEENFAAMVKVVRAAGARLVVFAVPHEFQLDPELRAEHGDRVIFPQRQLAKICARLEVPFLDPFDEFAKAREQRLYTDHLHLSEAGHRLAARRLLAFLRRRGLVRRAK